MIVAFKVTELEVILVAGPVVAMGSDNELELELDELLDKLELELELELDELLELKLEEVEVDELLELEIGKWPSGAIFTL